MPDLISTSGQQDLLDQASRQPAQQLEQTPSQSFADAWQANTRYNGVLSFQGNMADAAQDSLDAFEARTGERLPNPYRLPWNPMVWDITKQRDMLDMVRQRSQAKATELNDPSLAFPDEDKINAAGIANARQALAQQARKSDGQQAFGTSIASAAAGFGTQFTDPGNLALNALAIGTIPEGGLAMRLAGAAATFGAQQLGEEALTYRYKQQVTPEHGLGDVAGSVFGAAVGGAAMEAGGMAAHSLIGGLWRKMTYRAPDAAAHVPMEVADSARAAERVADIDANNPFKTGMSGEAAHNEAVVKIESDLLNGNAPDLPQAADGEAGLRTADVYPAGGERVARAPEIPFDAAGVKPEDFDTATAAGAKPLIDSGRLDRASAYEEAFVDHIGEKGREIYGEPASSDGSKTSRASIFDEKPGQGEGDGGTSAERGRAGETGSDAGTGAAADTSARSFFGNKSVRVKYELAESRDLIASHDADFTVNPNYPAELQPRDRSSVAARDQVLQMAQDLEPARLGPSPEANAGAPIVGPDNVVESGNGRTMAIRAAYDSDAAGAYRAMLERQGFDTTGFDQPVLIGRRVSAMSAEERAAFAHATNGSASLRMSATEQALSDARLIDHDTASLLKSGGVDSAGNRDFVRALVAKLPAGERGGMLTRGGTLSAAGVNRVKAALVARAYGDPGVVARAFDHPEPNIKTIASGLVDAAPDWIKMRDAVTRGEIKAGQDITDDVMQAVRSIMRARDEGRPVGEVMTQGNLFTSDTSQLAARLFFKDNRMDRFLSKSDMSANLTTFAQDTLKQRGVGDDLFGRPPPSTGDVLKGTVQRSDMRQVAVLDAFRPEALDKAVSDPKVQAAAEADLQRNIAQGKNRVPMMDEEGNVTLAFADKELRDLDGQIKAADEIAACASTSIEAAE